MINLSVSLFTYLLFCGHDERVTAGRIIGRTVTSCRGIKGTRRSQICEIEEGKKY